MDAGRYQNPVPDDAVDYVSDVNVSYKREQLDRVKDVWQDMYNEVFIHDALAGLGETHLLRRDIIMNIDRGSVGIRFAIAERFAWSRFYAARRCAAISRLKRAALALGAPLLPVLFLLRQTQLALSRGRHRGAFVRCLPLLALLNVIWGLGEFTGYLTGRIAAAPHPT